MADVTQTDPELQAPPHKAAPQSMLSGWLITLNVLAAIPTMLLMLIIWGSLPHASLGSFAQSAAQLGLPALLAIILGLMVFSVLCIAFLPWRWTKVHLPLVVVMLQSGVAIWLITALVPPLLPPDESVPMQNLDGTSELSEQ